MNPSGTTRSTVASLVTVTGRVQGVGFRPFIYRIAQQNQIHGWVQNLQGEVLIRAEGTAIDIEAFISAVTAATPPLARPKIESITQEIAEGYTKFSIKESRSGDHADIHLPPDQFTCNDCLDDLGNPADRRYNYPFINCTQCGPRYTIIKELPYDRPATSMAAFPLCPECEAEYFNPADRRFHAEPIACPVCGPRLQFCAGALEINETEAALEETIVRLTAGEIVAVKGIGGYHLLCDASNEEAVQKLRQRKQRPTKPLAVMFPQRGGSLLDAVQAELFVTDIESQRLIDPERPIVLCRKLQSGTLAPSIAPGLVEVGAMLPYSPLHHILLSRFNRPVVATSGNISGEPVITNNRDATHRLNCIIDAFLHHNRPIIRPADDSLYRVILDRPRPIRLGRGVAPLEMEISPPLSKTVLAVGGQMKNSIAIAWNNRVVISPHIGDLESVRSQQLFSQLIVELQQLYRVEIDEVVCDAHPDYDSHRIAHHIAQSLNLPVTEVLHHHAHASALYGEAHDADHGESNWLVFSWDGTGMGGDHTLWGGEAFIGKPGAWHRFASLRPFRLPGGEKAAREPWRSALALLWESGDKYMMPAITDGEISHDEFKLLLHAWQKAMNSPQSSAAGRLFDAAAALIGISHKASYEGEAPSRLEAIYQSSIKATPIQLPLTKDSSGIWRSDWSPLIPMLVNQKIIPAERSTIFHHSMAATIVEQAELAREKYNIEHIGLSGGVFQNRVLTELAAQHLQELGFVVHLSSHLPANDGGLCYGQIVEAASLVNENKSHESNR